MPGDAAWQTYVDEARVFLNFADQNKRHAAPVEQSADAMTGVGWALLALVEVLKPQDNVVLEVKPTELRDHVPTAFCGTTTEHEVHYWAVSEDVAVQGAMLVAKPTSLRWCRGVA